MIKNLVVKLFVWIKEQSRQPKLFMLDAVIVALTVLLVFMIGFAVEEASYSYHSYDEDSFYWRLESEEYASMVPMYYSNVAAGKEDERKLQEYYGVARYFEAASYYKMYIEAGDNVLAEKYYHDMEEAYVQMGDFGIIRAKIDAALGL